MAYVKLVPLALFLLATFLMFPAKNVEAADCWGVCSPFEWPYPCGSQDCRCIPWGLVIGQCIYPPSGSEHVAKMVEKHSNLCQSHDDCVQKESGSFCARYPNPDIEYGWCFASNSKAEAFFNVALSEATSFLKMPVA